MVQELTDYVQKLTYYTSWRHLTLHLFYSGGAGGAIMCKH